MIFRLHYQPLHGHVHCHLFVAPDPTRTFALCGHIVVRAGDEFDALKEALPNAEFLQDEVVKQEEYAWKH